MSRKIFILFSILIIASMVWLAAPRPLRKQQARNLQKWKRLKLKKQRLRKPRSCSAEKIKLTVEMSIYVEAPHKKAFDMLKEAYEKENPNIEIEYVGADYADFWGKLKTEVLAGLLKVTLSR